MNIWKSHWTIPLGILMLLLSTALTGYALEIGEISIQGNTLIPENTILTQLVSKVGTPYNPQLVSEDLQTIYNVGLFSSVEAHAEDVAGLVQLRFLVTERPLISRIEFTGNDKIDQRTLEEVLILSPSSLSDSFSRLKFYPLKIREDVESLKQLYYDEGYHNAQISSQLLPDPDAPGEKVILQYRIEERDKVAVRGVNFEGNTVFTESELRKNMVTRKKGFFSFLTGSGKYEETAFETDLERIKFFYIDHGYIDIKIIDYSLNFEEDTSDLYITITLKEGELYTIEDVNIIGNEVYSTDALRKVIQVAAGDPFSRTSIWEDKVAISELYAQKGYLTPITENPSGKLLIDPDIQVNREERTIALTYSIREGVPHVLDRVMIVGNHKTRDKVIRRELKVYEGELFNSKLMERSRQKVFNLGFFEDVEFNLMEGDAPDSVKLEIDVTERSTGSFNFGGGWGSIDQWMISGGFTTPNLFGLAHEIDFSATLSRSSQRFNISYTVPRIFDSLYTLGADAYNTQRDYSAYDSERTGGGIRFGRRITENIFGTLKYQYEEIDITDVEEDASALIREAEGQSTTSSVGLSLRRSTVNNVLLPTRGLVTRLSGEMAGGLLQAENDFYKLSLDNTVYFPLYKNFALRFRGEAAYVTEYGDSVEVPIFERLFAGGSDTIRGFEERSVGPKDENDEAIGGNTRLLFTSEIIIPIQEKVRFVTFYDTGDVYGPDEDIDLSSFRHGAGVGIRFFSPLGLLKLDWGFKLDKEPGESDYEFHFGLGGGFF